MRHGEIAKPMFISEQMTASIYDLQRGMWNEHEFVERHVWSPTACRWTCWTFDAGFKASMFLPHVESDMWVEVMIPFSGFYESWHDVNLDSAVDMIATDENGHDFDDEVLSKLLCDGVKWKKAYAAYSPIYVEVFLENAEIKGFFSALESPREYNFTNDRLFAKLDRFKLREWLDDPAVKARVLVVAKEWFTSRSGFISFYDSDLADWPDFEDWDHNQLGVLVQAYADVHMARDHKRGFNMEDEDTLMEGPRCNGVFEGIIWDSLENAQAVSDRIDKLNEERKEHAA